MADRIQSEIGLHPSDWSISRIDSLFDIQQGKSVSKEHRQGNNQKPFLRTKNIFWGRIDISELDRMNFTDAEEARLELKAGDLLLCEGGDVGRTAIWNGQMKDCFYQNHLHRLRTKTTGKIDPQFVLFWFWYAFEFANIYIGRSNVTTIPNLSQSKLSELYIPTPGLDEQRRIAHVLTAVQTAIEQQARLIALTRELKSALMKKLFTEGLKGEPQKETEIGLVPESWKVVKLQEAVEYIDYGYSAPIPKTEPINGMKIVSTADINRAGELLYWKIRRTIAPEKTVKRLTLEGGDVLFNWRNSAELIGKTTIFEQQPEPHIFASFILRIRCDEKRTHNYYLKHLLNHYREQEVFVKLSRRAVNQANYNRNEIFELKIPFPEYSEQCEIALAIGAVESKIYLHESKKNLLEELFRTLLHQLMTGQVRVSEIDFEGLKIKT